MKEYKKIFGVNFCINEMDVRDLPVYLTAKRSFFKLSYTGIEFILIVVSAKEKFGVVAFEKQSKQVSARYGMPVAFGFDNVSKLQRDSLMERDIPFISDSGQLYLPFLGMALIDRFIQPKEIKTQKMMPVTQALFLYLLYNGNGNSILKKDAAQAMGVTKTSITRASDQLNAMGLISQELSGKECHMRTNGRGMQLIEKAKPYLINPVQRAITILADDQHEMYQLSGESALAAQTMLNDPRIPVRAVYKAKVDSGKMQDVDIRWEPDANVLQLELWKYDPHLFEKGGIVDPVSLAMSMETTADERIEGAMKEYLEGYQW